VTAAVAVAVMAVAAAVMAVAVMAVVVAVADRRAMPQTVPS
jgi:hypothetical protein